MKTPRELLLARHQAAIPKLDVLRQSAVAAVGDRRISRKDRRPATVATAVAVIWRELVFPCRRIWTGLAAAWLVIFVINVSQRDPDNSVTGQPARPGTVMVSWQTQQRWMNELLADRAPSSEADRPRHLSPRPRTENGQVGAA